MVGVLDAWMPAPKYFDLNNGDFDDMEDVYIPWGWTESGELQSAGNTNCWKPEDIVDFKGFLASECVWIQMWVQLPDAAARSRMQDYLDNYTSAQRRLGRFARPQNNRLTPVDRWLVDNNVVPNDNRVLVGLAFAFLAVCLINTVGLLLAKFLSSASISGIRRALGASRRDIFAQHLTEAGVLAFVGAAWGLMLGAMGLAGLRALNANATQGYQRFAQADLDSVAVALGLALLATLTSGLYPAWRIGRIAPATYLKSQ